MRAILRKEWLEARRDGRVRLLVPLLVLVIAALLLAGYAQFRHHAEVQQRAQAHERERWLGQGEKHPHAAAHYGVHAFRPPGVLSYFDPGLEPYLGVNVWMEAHRQNIAQYQPARDGGTLQRFPPLTPALLLGWMLPLLLSVCAVPLVAGEREAGTLRQLLAQGVSPRRLLWGKALALGLLAVLVVLVVLALFLVLVLWLEPTADTLVRLGLLALALCLFLGAVVLLSLAVSALARSEVTALAWLLLFWLVTTLVAPRLLVEWVELRHPVPEVLEFQRELAAALDDPEAVAARLEARLEALLREHGERDPDALPVRLEGLRLQVDDAHGYAVFDRHFGRLFDLYQRQEDALQRAGIWAPWLAWQAWTNGVAGTDLHHFRHFVAAAEHHRRLIQDTMSDAIMAAPEQVLEDAALWSRIPPFHYHAPAFHRVEQHYRPALLALAMWLLAGVVALEVAARRLGRAP